MSKISNKARLTQLKEWMESRSKKSSSPRRTKSNFSKADHYKSKQ